MSENRSRIGLRPSDSVPPANGRFVPAGRRAADRHYLAVVAAEARRLAREFRPAASRSAPIRRVPEGCR